MITPPYEPGPHERACGDIFSSLEPPIQPLQISAPTSIFICFTNRSGSYWLSECLSSSGHLPLAGELFNEKVMRASCSKHPDITSLSAYGSWLRDTHKQNNYFITKVSPKQLFMLCGHRLIPDIFPSPRFITIKRRDLLAQAISLTFAQHQGTWRGDSNPDEEPEFNFNELRLKTHGLAVANAQMDAFFSLNGIAPFSVIYEDLVDDPEGLIERLSAWLKEPRLRYCPTSITARKHGTALKESWHNRFLDCVHASS